MIRRPGGPVFTGGGREAPGVGARGRSPTGGLCLAVTAIE